MNNLINEPHLVFGVIWLVIAIFAKDRAKSDKCLIISNVWIAASLL